MMAVITFEETEDDEQELLPGVIKQYSASPFDNELLVNTAVRLSSGVLFNTH